MTKKAIVLFAFAMPLAACGSSSPISDDLLKSMDAFARGPNRVVALGTALYDQGTLDVVAPDDVLLTSIKSRLATETSSCAMVTQTTGKLAVAFPSCILQTGVVPVTGSGTITINHDLSETNVVFNFDGTTTGEAITGEMIYSTTDGNVFTTAALITYAGNAMTLLNYNGVDGNASVVLSTDGTTPIPGTDGGAVTRALHYDGVTERFSACHPNDGTLRLSSPSENIDVTLQFADTTPQTGDVTVTDEGSTFAATLPTLPSCPPVPSS